jgi:hypothetical protein
MMKRSHDADAGCHSAKRARARGRRAQGVAARARCGESVNVTRVVLDPSNIHLEVLSDNTCR